MRFPAILLTLSALSLAACADSEAGGVGSTEQAGTAGQDVEVARLRLAFQQGRSPFDPSTATGTPLSTRLYLGSRSSGGAQFVWQCGRRDAGLNAAPAQTPTTYSFLAQGAAEVVAVDPEHAGATFLHDVRSSELVGYAGNFVVGALGRYQAVRVGNNDDLIIEEFLRPTVASLSGPDATTYQAQLQTHDSSVVGEGPALAYTRCSRREVTVQGQRVVLSDDFSDTDYTHALWGPFVNPTRDGISLSAIATPWISTPAIGESMGTIDFAYRDRSGPLTVQTDCCAIIIDDSSVRTSGGALQQMNVPSSAHVSIDIEPGVVNFFLDGMRFVLPDSNARPFVYQGQHAYISWSTSNLATIDDVRIAVP